MAVEECFIVQLNKFLDAAGECTDADEQEWYVTKVKEMGVYIYNRFVQTLDHPHRAAAMQLLEAMVNWRRRLEADVEVSVNASWRRFKAFQKRYGTTERKTIKDQVENARRELAVDTLTSIRNNLYLQRVYLSSIVEELTELNADSEKIKAGTELKASIRELEKFTRVQLKDCEKAAEKIAATNN